MKYSSKVVSVHELEIELNAYSEQGWHLIAIHPAGVWQDDRQFVLIHSRPNSQTENAEETRD